MATKQCQICGNNSGMYPLCKKHLEMKNKGEVIKNKSTGKWELKQTVADYFDEIDNENIEKNFTTIINKDNKSKCISCGKSTDGLLFCTSCYYKYKDKELLIKISNCSNIEILDENYEGRYTCKDGHIVKSKSERDIDNYLFEHNIPHAYEKELPYGANEKDVLHPDFFLQDYLGKGKHVYIEHWGYNENNIKYTNTKNFKIPIYKNLKITLICTYEKSDMGKIDSVLERKLNPHFIKENQINFEE